MSARVSAPASPGADRRGTRSRSAGGGNRTHTPRRTREFKSLASTVPPLRQRAWPEVSRWCAAGALAPEGRRPGRAVDRIDAAFLDQPRPLLAEDGPAPEHLVVPHVASVLALGEDQPPFVARIADVADRAVQAVDGREPLEPGIALVAAGGHGGPCE